MAKIVLNLLVILTVAMAGCTPTGHRASSDVYKDEIAAFGSNNCNVGTVTIVKYKNTEYFCIASEYSNSFNDSDLVILRNLNLKNKKLLYGYVNKNYPNIDQITISGWQSSNPLKVDGRTIVYSLVPTKSLVNNANK